VEVSGQLHITAALIPGKGAPLHVEEKAGSNQNRFEYFGEERKF
jgi:hypothetical protein